MKKTLCGLLICATSFLSSANGAINIIWNFGDFYLADETTDIPLGSLGVIVADLDGSGFATEADIQGATLSVGNTFGLATNRIIDIFSGVSTGSGTGFLPGLVNYTFSDGWNALDALAIYWFPTISTTGTSLVGGESFGFYTNPVASINSGGDQGLITPADGNDVTIAYFTDPPAAGTGITASDFSANLTVVPEPTSLLLLGLGILGLVARRRR